MWPDEWMDRCIDEWMDGQTQKDEWMDRHGYNDGWMDVKMNGWMNA